uniref:Uncharacterized protein n=1 Tax=Lactuca sativa TaxID=4236 RepID=A0A9R1XFL2_LACSA|nr:hypothetical protein LSAT_V11C500263370 [Lactuca sativa]
MKNTAAVHKEDDYAISVEATVNARKISVTKKVIHEVLWINDNFGFPVFVRLGYEGVFPPTIKKLLPPYWRFLAHVFVSCISGRRAGADEISLLNTGAIVALATGLDFNFFRYILNEMSFGSTTFGLMKKNRKGKFMFEGKYPLVIFSQFTEVSSASETKISSSFEKTEDEVIIVSKHEEEPVAPVVIVFEEHVPVTNKEENDDENANDDDESDFEINLMENVKEKDDGEDDLDQSEDLLNQDIRLSIEDVDAFFDNANEVAQSATETNGDDDVLKTTPLTSTQMANPSNIMDTTSRISIFLLLFQLSCLLIMISIRHKPPSLQLNGEELIPGREC